jgi:hypothetical protein
VRTNGRCGKRWRGNQDFHGVARCRRAFQGGRGCFRGRRSRCSASRITRPSSRCPNSPHGRTMGS